MKNSWAAEAGKYTFSVETENELILFENSKPEDAAGIDSLINDDDTVKLEIWDRNLHSATPVSVSSILEVNGKKVREPYQRK